MRQRVLGALILLGAVAIAALLIVTRPEPPEKPQEELIPLVQAEKLEIRSGNLMINGAGTVRAREELTLAAEVAGKLVYVNPNLREGQRIGKGATLFRIDPSDYRNAVDTARADVASQNVAVLQAREEVASAEAELVRFQQRREKLAGDVSEAEAAGSRILPPEELARSAVTEADRVSGTIAANELATRKPQLRSAQAGLARAQAQLSNARTSLMRTVVKAPFTGVVRAEQVARGSYVQPGQSLGSIVSTTEYEAVIPLSEREAALIPQLFNVGSGGRIQAAVFSDYGGIRYRWNAYVDRVGSLLNPQTRTIDVYLRIPNPLRGGTPAAAPENEGKSAGAAPPLFVGGFVSAEIEGLALDEYAVLPLSALRAGDKIWLVRDGKLDIVEVEIFQRTDTSALISATGLGANPTVVIGSLPAATTGMKVRVAEATTATAAPKASASGAKSAQ